MVYTTEDRVAQIMPDTSGAAALYVVFQLDQNQFGLELASVDRVVNAVEAMPLPCAPPVVQGVILVAGVPLPLIDLRRRLRFPARAVGLDDHFLLVRSSRRRLALIVDRVQGVERIAAGQLESAEALIPGLAQVKGLARTASGLVLIQDLEACLSSEEEEGLEQALSSL